jgi:hypothetical protein
MNAEFRVVAAGDVQALLPLVEQYWLFEDIAGFELLDKPLPDRRENPSWRK